jgi:hypothetical protein
MPSQAFNKTELLKSWLCAGIGTSFKNKFDLDSIGLHPKSHQCVAPYPDRDVLLRTVARDAMRCKKEERDGTAGTVHHDQTQLHLLTCVDSPPTLNSRHSPGRSVFLAMNFLPKFEVRGIHANIDAASTERNFGVSSH